MKTTYVFHNDPGHAWLAVKRAELKRLGILDKISGCSYQNGNTVYLEEDCDASLFLDAKEKADEKVTKEQVRESYKEYTPIRTYERFRS